VTIPSSPAARQSNKTPSPSMNNELIRLSEVLESAPYRCLLANKLDRKGLPVDWRKINVERNRFDCDEVVKGMKLSLDYVCDPEAKRLREAVKRSESRKNRTGRADLLALITKRDDRMIPLDPVLIVRIKGWLSDLVTNDRYVAFKNEPVMVSLDDGSGSNQVQAQACIQQSKGIHEEGGPTALANCCDEMLEVIKMKDAPLHTFLMGTSSVGDMRVEGALSPEEGIRRARAWCKRMGIRGKREGRRLVFRVLTLVGVAFMALGFTQFVEKGDGRSETHGPRVTTVFFRSKECAVFESRQEYAALLESKQCRAGEGVRSGAVLRIAMESKQCQVDQGMHQNVAAILESKQCAVPSLASKQCQETLNGSVPLMPAMKSSSALC
jgi:hypothetical protein